MTDYVSLLHREPIRWHVIRDGKPYGDIWARSKSEAESIMRLQDLRDRPLFSFFPRRILHRYDFAPA